MDNVYVRIVLYVLSSILSMIPLAWTNWINFNSETMILTVDLQGLAAAIVVALGTSFTIFKKWGNK